MTKTLAGLFVLVAWQLMCGSTAFAAEFMDDTFDLVHYSAPLVDQNGAATIVARRILSGGNREAAVRGHGRQGTACDIAGLPPASAALDDGLDCR